MIFQWDETNTQHVEEHGISPGEAEYIVSNAQPPFPEGRGGGKLLVWGQTDAADYLQVVFVFLPDAEVDVRPMRPHDHAEFLTGAPVVYVIHAMPLNRHKKSRLKNRKKKKRRQ